MQRQRRFHLCSVRLDRGRKPVRSRELARVGGGAPGGGRAGDCGGAARRDGADEPAAQGPDCVGEHVNDDGDLFNPGTELYTRRQNPGNLTREHLSTMRTVSGERSWQR